MYILWDILKVPPSSLLPVTHTALTIPGSPVSSLRQPLIILINAPLVGTAMPGPRICHQHRLVLYGDSKCLGPEPTINLNRSFSSATCWVIWLQMKWYATMWVIKFHNTAVMMLGIYVSMMQENMFCRIWLFVKKITKSLFYLWKTTACLI